MDRRISKGSPVIVGTRTRVLDIAIEYEYLGTRPDEIVDAHPHLTLPQVHFTVITGVSGMRGEKKPEEIKPILEDVKKCLKNIYGKQLKGIILFGSYARGDSTEGSDIDIILLLEGIEDPVAEKEKFFDVMNIIDLTLPITNKTP
ncbi:MAG: nucleotidyltransferase domain-containing protein, partial [Methanophagales archaeon]|nr:nucleotidyltransferase domain-containing protein [Methanophagales archaeon]